MHQSGCPVFTSSRLREGVWSAVASCRIHGALPELPEGQLRPSHVLQALDTGSVTYRTRQRRARGRDTHPVPFNDLGSQEDVC